MKPELIIIHCYFWPKFGQYVLLAKHHIEQIEYRSWFDSLEFFAMVPLYVLCMMFLFGFNLKWRLLPAAWLALVAGNAALWQIQNYSGLFDLFGNLALFWPIYIIVFVYVFINKGKAV